MEDSLYISTAELATVLKQIVSQCRRFHYQFDCKAAFPEKRILHKSSIRECS